MLAPARADAAVTAQQILAQARAANDNLSARGLRAFTATVTFDWAKMFGAKAGDEQLNLLRKLHYTLTMDTRSQITLTYTVDGPPDPAHEKLYADLYRANVLVLGGTFTTWGGFAFRSLLPDPDGRYTLDLLPDAYRVSYDDPPGRLVIDLRKTFEMSALRVTSTDLVATIEPYFRKTPHGFALVGYAKRSENVSKREKTAEFVRIANDVVRGYELPHTVVSESVAGGRTNRVAFTLSDYRLFGPK